MLGLLLGAAVLGTVIAVMEDGEFPGWWAMIVCILAGILPEVLLGNVLPRRFFFVAYAAGAVCAAGAIAYMCGMSFKRASIAASIYFLFNLVFALVITALVHAG